LSLGSWSTKIDGVRINPRSHFATDIQPEFGPVDTRFPNIILKFIAVS
jgi:hypothetical protein